MISANSQPQTMEEALAVSEGRDLEVFRRETALLAELRSEAESYIDLPPQDWPPLTFNWDFTRESQRFALDGVKPADFELQYPEGFCLGWVSLSEFDEKLCHCSRRDNNDELWNLGFKSSLARVIAHLARGLPITPPLVGINSVGELCILGGNHRYAVAKTAKCATHFPIYFEPLRHDQINNIVSIRRDGP